MKPIFTIHAGEYLVGSHIESKFKKLNVWLPTKARGEFHPKLEEALSFVYSIT
jgi:hypothetical protein